MTVYAFYIFDRHGESLRWYPGNKQIGALELTSSPFSMIAECIYKRRWQGRPMSISSKSSSIAATQPQQSINVESKSSSRSAEDDAKLIFGTVFSLRNMVRKLGGENDR